MVDATRQMTAAGVSVGGVVGRIFAWWTAELSALLPANLRRALGLDPDILVLDVAPDTIAIGLDRAGRYDLLVAPQQGSARESAVAGPLAEPGRRASWAFAALRLTPEQALVREIELPLAAEENLREVLEFEMERHTPFRAEQVDFYFEILSRDGERNRLRLRLVAIPKERLAALVADAARWGISPALVTVGVSGTALIRKPALFPTGAPPKTYRAIDRRLALVAVALLVLLALLPLWRAEMRLDSLEPRLAAMRPAAEDALVVEREIAAELTGEASVARLKAERPSAVAVLDELSRLLPDDSYLVQLSITRGEIVLEGTSPSAAGLVGLLENSPLFERARFRTPVMRDPLTGREHFSLAVDLSSTAPAK